MQNLILACLAFLSPVSTAIAAPLDAPGTVYIDGLPCNRACQAYMAWSRRVLEQAPGPSIAVTSKQSLPDKVQKTAKRTPNKPASANIAVRTTSNRGGDLARTDSKSSFRSAKPGNVEKPGEIPGSAGSVTSSITNPDSGSESAKSSEQGATVPPVQALEAAGGSIGGIDTKPPGSEAAVPSDAAIALASPKADQLVAILLSRSEIKSVPDLANQTVAIDASDSNSIPALKSAMATAGAGAVQLSEDKNPALIRVMDGEVPAGVVLVGSPEEAAAWTVVPGFNVLRLPLVSPAERAAPG